MMYIIDDITHQIVVLNDCVYRNARAVSRLIQSLINLAKTKQLKFIFKIMNKKEIKDYLDC